MSESLTHQIEPELLLPKPRKIRPRRGKDGSGMGFMRVFLIPFIVVGAYQLAIVLGGFASFLSGRMTYSQSMDWFFTIGWNAVVFLLVYVCFITPWLYQRLYSHGNAVIGTIVDKRQNNQYLLEYTFSPAKDAGLDASPSKGTVSVL